MAAGTVTSNLRYASLVSPKTPCQQVCGAGVKQLLRCLSAHAKQPQHTPRPHTSPCTLGHLPVTHTCCPCTVHGARVSAHTLHMDTQPLSLTHTQVSLHTCGHTHVQPNTYLHAQHRGCPSAATSHGRPVGAVSPMLLITILGQGW